MRSNRLLIIFLFAFVASAAVISEKKNGGLLNSFKVLFKSLPANQSVIKDIEYTSPTTLTSMTETSTQNKLEIQNTTIIEDSVLPVNKTLELSTLLRKGNLYSLLRSVERQYCGQYCTPTNVGYSALALLIALGYIAHTISVSVSVGVAAAAAEDQEPLDLIVSRFACQETPENNLDIPVDEPGLPDNGCGTSSVRFEGNALDSETSVQQFDNGFCAPLLRRGPCTSPFEWVTADPNTFEVLLTDNLYL